MNALTGVLLPAGLKERNYTIDMVVMIRNKYGQFVEYRDKDFTVKVWKILTFSCLKICLLVVLENFRRFILYDLQIKFA